MLYISRPQSEAFLSKVAEAVQQQGTHPIVFQVSGIGGVGKSTLLEKLKETQKQTQVVQISFGETEEIDDPIQLMKKLHWELEKQYPTPKGLHKDVRDILSKPDPFSKLYEQFWDTSHQLQTQSVDGKAVSDEQQKQVKQLLKEGVSGLGDFFLPGVASNTLGKAAELSVDAARLLLSEKDRLLQQHPATKAKRELQELMENPVPKLTHAFTESLVLRSKKCPVILILDTYEKAQPGIDRWLWRSLLCNTELQPYPIRLVVAGRYPLTKESEWRIAINPNDHEAWCQKFKALTQLERTVEATLCWKRALDINPDNPDLPPIPENLLELLRNLRNHLEAADNPEELLRELGETGELESLMSLLEETDKKAN